MNRAGRILCSTLKVPEGWHYQPTRLEFDCGCCGRHDPAEPGCLSRIRPVGLEKSWPLVGNRTAKQEREMVEAIIAAHPLRTAL